MIRYNLAGLQQEKQQQQQQQQHQQHAASRVLEERNVKRERVVMNGNVGARDTISTGKEGVLQNANVDVKEALNVALSTEDQNACAALVCNILAEDAQLNAILAVEEEPRVEMLVENRHVSAALG